MIAPVLADWIITVLRYAKSAYSVRAVDHKLRVVCSPFNPDRQVDREAALLAEPGVTAETRFLACVGQLIESKWPIHFVDVVAAYIEAHPEVPVMGLVFCVVPDEFPALDRAALYRASERGIADRIKLLGFKSPFRPYLAAVELLVVPSLNEPFWRTLIEAISLGTVVVATDDGGNPKAIVNGKPGFLVGSEDIVAFVPLIHRMLSNPQPWSKSSVPRLPKPPPATNPNPICAV